MGQWYTAAEDEDMLLIAHKHGFRCWETIYEHEQNAELRRLRPNPYLLYKDERVWIPDKTPREDKCETGQRHTFTLPEPNMVICLQLQNDHAEPYADCKYEIWIDGACFTQGLKRTDPKGIIREEVPLREEAQVRIWFETELEKDPEACEIYTLEMGHLEPVETIEGIQDRLRNLGYDCGKENGSIGPKTEEAIMAFQADVGFDPSGKIALPPTRKDPTVKRLYEWHDCLGSDPNIERTIAPPL